MSCPDTNPCRLCGGEGHLNCLPGEEYVVDCEDCSNSIHPPEPDPERAIARWNHANPMP